jgi:hypothetical protein
MNIDRFTQGYLETAVWASTNDEGESLDALGFDADSFTQAAKKRAKRECRDFLTMAKSLLKQAGADESSAGQDFWLTRNGHGAGFWDRGYGSVGDELSKIAKTFGESYIVVSRGRLSFA